MSTVRAVIYLIIAIIFAMMFWSIGLFKIPFMEQLTERQQLREDEVECGVYIVLVDTKAAKSRSKELEDKIIKTLLKHHEVYKTRICDILYRMTNLVAPNAVRSGVPNRQSWYLKTEFVFEVERKRALRVRIRDLWSTTDLEWKATHYIRPDRPRTAGNQTEAEKKALRAALKSLGTEGEFEFFGP